MIQMIREIYAHRPRKDESLVMPRVNIRNLASATVPILEQLHAPQRCMQYHQRIDEPANPTVKPYELVRM